MISAGKQSFPSNGKDRYPRTDESVDFPEEMARKDEKVVYSKREMRQEGKLQVALACDSSVMWHISLRT